MAVPVATSARIGTHRTRVRGPDAGTAATALAPFSINTVDVPVAGGRRGSVFHRCLDHGGPARGNRCSQRRPELVGRLDEHAVGAIAPGDLGEVGAVARAVGF